VLEIDEWCVNNIDRRLKVNHAKSRKPSINAPLYFDRRLVVKFRDDTDERMRAAIANAISLVTDLKLADKFWNDEASDDNQSLYMRRIRDNRDLQKRIQEKVRVVSLNHIKVDNLHVSCPTLDFFTSMINRGVYVVRVNDDNSGFHAICIDTRECPGYIYDCAEDYAMKLCADSIKLCVGDDNEFIGMSDLREVVKITKRSGYKRRLSRTERKLIKRT